MTSDNSRYLIVIIVLILLLVVAVVIATYYFISFISTNSTAFFITATALGLLGAYSIYKRLRSRQHH
ncbi:hypothetical protein EWF20_05090 [Sulfolobus sp. S-194]|uniref:hypothetical protein n=1 Tax=Sulfolobus sp. S-194 TaxID=2512240 RepID=UPI001436FA8C|nr:hypothetical protein [Sulfolobus sp. S-194]QIW23594.1 hypothetical protein EWF20_05090 [Sulfolobus sp. S-194]